MIALKVESMGELTYLILTDEAKCILNVKTGDTLYPP